MITDRTVELWKAKQIEAIPDDLFGEDHTGIRTRNIVRRLGKPLHDIANMTDAQILAQRGVGPIVLKRIRTQLQRTQP